MAPTCKKTLIVCDVQPDVVRKLPERERFVDLVQMAIEAAARRSSSTTTRIIYTMIRFDEPNYVQIAPSHPRLGVLRRLADNNKNTTTVKWFTSDALSVDVNNNNNNEIVVPRTTFLPHANQERLMDVLRQACGCSEDTADDDAAATTPTVTTLLGYGPTVQALCHLLGDALPPTAVVPHCNTVQILRDCCSDERPDRCRAFLEHGCLFDEQVISLVDYLEQADLLHEQIIIPTTPSNTNVVKYVCDTGRGGHLTLYLPYLLRDHGHVEWPTQPWYQEQQLTATNTTTKQYHCPLGRRTVDLCDEPQFSRSLRFFLAGREHLDEKHLLQELVPDLMPPTFDSIQAATVYAAEQQQQPDNDKTLLWFIKVVNQNGGRAVRVTNDLSSVTTLTPSEQLQAHVPRPLLYKGQFKFHIKTYQHISCQSGGIWNIYIHDLFYLATASRPWTTNDLSDAAQITTLRTHRLLPNDALRQQYNLTELINAKVKIVMERAIQQNRLQQAAAAPSNHNGDTNHALAPPPPPQFEVHSADWMLDQDGRVYLIECNGIPVLYDPTSPQKQALVTNGLQLYDKLYHQATTADGGGGGGGDLAAVVNDTQLIRDALELALTGKVPRGSLWRHLTTISAPKNKAGQDEVS